MSETPLSKISGWDLRHVARLEGVWITTAEQVVALVATDGGIESLSEQLNVSVEEARRLVSCARASLAPSKVAELEARDDSAQYGLGALEPPEER